MSPAEYRDAILRLGFSQKAAAEFFGRSGGQGQRWAQGWSPLPKSVAMLLQLMLRYGIKPKELISGTPSPCSSNPCSVTALGPKT
jgi:hypothetical protein